MIIKKSFKSQDDFIDYCLVQARFLSAFPVATQIDIVGRKGHLVFDNQYL